MGRTDFIVSQWAALRRSHFARNVAVVASGTAAAQVITIALTPLITRLYGPEAYGVMGTFASLLAVLAPIAAFTYPLALVLPRHDKEALALLGLTGRIAVGVAITLAFALWWRGDALAMLLGIESLGGLIYLLPLALLVTAFFQMAQQWLIRKKGFPVLARAAVGHSGLLNSAKALTGFVYPAGLALVVLNMIGQLVHILLLVLGMRKHMKVENNQRETAAPISTKKLAIRYVDFPLYRAPQNLINAASQSLPIILLASYAGPVAAGFYTLGRSIMGVPSTLIGTSVTQVFYPRVTEAAYQGEDVAPLIIKATLLLFAVAVVPFGLVVLFGPWLFGLVFGSDWSQAGEYARWLALFFLFNFINKPSVAAVPALGIQRGLLIYEVMSTGAKVIGFMLGLWLWGSDLVAVAAFSVIGVVAYLAMILWIIDSARKSSRYAKTSQ